MRGNTAPIVGATQFEDQGHDPCQPQPLGKSAMSGAYGENSQGKKGAEWPHRIALILHATQRQTNPNIQHKTCTTATVQLFETCAEILFSI